MGCCDTVIEKQFSPEKVDADLERFRSRGPDDTTRRIIGAIESAGFQDASLLDIGAGIGAIHHVLLPRRLSSAVHVEISDAYVEAARSESQSRGNADRVRFVRGDFVQVAARAGTADIVTLDRVICCYPDLEPLLTRSAESCGRLLVLSFPRDRWYVRVVIRIQNLVRALTGNSFRSFVHPLRRIEELLQDAGFRLLSSSDSPIWRVAAFQKHAA